MNNRKTYIHISTKQSVRASSCELIRASKIPETDF